MKKAYFLLLPFFALVSCSSDSSSSSTGTSNVLQKVVFYYNTANETHWNFNTNGLLDNITKLDGTLVEKFRYDAANNVIEDIKYTNGLPNLTYSVTYDDAHIIKTINGVDYNYVYDASGFNYFYSSGTEEFSCQINYDMLITNYTHSDTGAEPFNKHYEAVYDNGDLLSFKKTTNSTTDFVRNYGYGNVTINDNGNPLRNACMPVMKLKSLTEPEFFMDGIFSQSLVQSLNFGSASTMRYNFGFLTYDNNHLSQQDIEVYNGDTFVELIPFIQYHYQD